MHGLTKTSADAKQYCVIVHFLHAEILQEDTRVSIYIRPGILDFTSFSQNGWHNHVHL